MLRTNPLLYTITQLREQEQLFLSDQVYRFKPKELQEVIDYLSLEFQREAKNFPDQAPVFDAKAAEWAATVIFHTASLILFRDQSDSYLKQIKPYFSSIHPSAIVSADLTLRFLPQLYFFLKKIDSEDPALVIIENILQKWPYSAIHTDLEPVVGSYDLLKDHNCIRQLFIDRVVEKKALNWARDEEMKLKITKALEPYKEQIWSAL